MFVPVRVHPPPTAPPPLPTQSNLRVTGFITIVPHWHHATDEAKNTNNIARILVVSQRCAVIPDLIGGAIAVGVSGTDQRRRAIVVVLLNRPYRGACLRRACCHVAVECASITRRIDGD